MDNVHGLLGGRFYELYGYDPGFSSDGSSCVKELVAAHPDKFERSSSPKAGAVFFAIGHNHVGIVIAVSIRKKGLVNKILHVRSIKIYIRRSSVC